jgi:asparagine synthase (glutamine-hydrolysing)
VLAEFVLALPEQYIIAADGTSKSVFRAAMRGLVPDAILDRRDKIGFATPELRWLGELGGWVERILAAETVDAIPALVPQAVTEEWRGILAGSRRFDWHVWRWINLIRWSERFAVSYEI